MRIVVDVKRDANSAVVLNKLYKYTALQSSFSVNNVALVKGRPKMLNLRDLIENFVEHRHEVVTRRTQYELDKAREKAHILEGFMKVIGTQDALDRAIYIIRHSQTPQEAKSGLITEFELSEIQAQAILDLRLARLTGMELDKIREEYEDILRKIDDLLDILAKVERRMAIIIEELEEIKTKYGDKRRTEIVYASEEMNPEDFYSNDQMIITISHQGYIKRTALSEFKAQNRGGMGAKGGATKDEDFIEYIYPATMHNYMLFFTQKGRCYWLKVYEIPEGNKTSKGRAIQNMLNIENDDKVNAFIRVKTFSDKDFNDTHYIIFCTKKGTIKKTALEQYSRPRQNGVNAINIEDGDQVIQVRLTDGNSEIVLANRNGRAIRFNEQKVRPMGRNATGVIGMTLDDDGQDEVIGMICVPQDSEETVMVVSEQGYGKRTYLDETDENGNKVNVYRITNRGGKGVTTLKITEKTGKLVAIKNVTDENDLMIINKSGIAIRMHVSDIRTMGRATQGVRLINLEKRNDEIASVCKVNAEAEEEIVEEIVANVVENLETTGNSQE